MERRPNDSTEAVKENKQDQQQRELDERPCAFVS